MAKRSWLGTLFRIQYFVSFLCFATATLFIKQKTDVLIPYTGEGSTARVRCWFECFANCERSDTCWGVTLVMMMSETINCRMFEFNRGADLSSVKYYNMSETDPSHVTWVTSGFQHLDVTAWIETMVTSTATVDPDEGKNSTHSQRLEDR